MVEMYRLPLYIAVFFLILIPVIHIQAAVNVPVELNESLNLGRMPNKWKFRGDDNKGYRDPGYDDSKWETVDSLPHNWSDETRRPFSRQNICWYRLTITFSSAFHDKPLLLRLGPIEDADETYFNGIFIGSEGVIDGAGSRPRKFAGDKIRIYSIPSSLIRTAGPNVLSIRVQSLYPFKAGFAAVQSSALLGVSHFILKQFFIENLIQILIVIMIIFVSSLYIHHYIFQSYENRQAFFLITCIVIAVYYLMRSQFKFYISDDYMFLKGAEHISNFFMINLMMWFIFWTFPDTGTPLKKVRKYLMIGASAIPLISTAVILISRDIVFWHWYRINVADPLWIVPFVFIFWILIEHSVNGDNSIRNEKNALYMLIGFTGGFLCIFSDMLYDRAILTIGLLGHYAIFIVIILHYFITTLHWRNEYGFTERLRGLDSFSIIQRIENSMGEKKVFYDDEMNLKKFSEIIGIRQDQLSALINKVYKKNFNAFINEYRINEAKNIMLENRERTVISIVYAVGFNSVTAFQNAFKKTMNCTPTEFRKRL